MMASLLRLLTCGSVDDGKSTLIGRLLYDCGAVPTDKLDGLTDFAMLADGLEAEREQGITIDVAHLYFASEKRRFILADTPGHEQYTRNMATGASGADVAILLVDATKGVLTQTRRHATIAHLLGIRHFALAVNKMDLVAWDEAQFAAICGDFGRYAAAIGIENVQSIPVSATGGDNVATSSAHMLWYRGPALLPWLEAVAPEADAALPFRMPVQTVIREPGAGRLYAGTIAGGAVRPGDRVAVAPAGTPATVARIVTMAGELDEAAAGASVALAFTHEVDCSRGDMIAAAEAPPQIADQFEAMLIWMSEEALLPGRQYLLKIGTHTVPATVQEPKYKIGIDTMEQLAARTLALNEIGAAVIHTAQPVAFEPYETSRTLGGFILIDRITSATVAAGLIRFALRRSENIHEQAIDVTPERRAALKLQRPKLLWFTGLSGAGKSTIANIVERKLHARGRHTFLLDGDNVRLGLNRDLGFTAADRVENIRRAGEAAKLMLDAGLIVLTAFISPFRAEREMVRAMVAEGDFVEIFVDTPLAEAERRDTKGLYRKARAGQLANFTGVDSPYEAPLAPEIRIDTQALDAEAAADLIVSHLDGQGR
jgi:bifunctional enzyme CysN/CysC